MQVLEDAAVEMDATEARRLFLEYRTAVRTARGNSETDLRRRQEDEAMMRAYREVSKGVRVIRLGDVIAAGGSTILKGIGVTRWANGGHWTQDGILIPKLAVGRADMPFVWTSGIHQDGSLVLTTRRRPAPNNRRDVMNFEAGTFARSDWHASVGWSPVARSLLPPIPPSLRPTPALKNYHVLWEAEWTVDKSVPPGDPALLRHIGGDLYAVLAVWDLTDLERAVLHGRPVDDE